MWIDYLYWYFSILFVTTFKCSFKRLQDEICSPTFQRFIVLITLILPQLAWDKRLCCCCCCCCCCASSPVQRLRTVLPSPVGVWVSVSLTLQNFFAHTKYHLESNTVITCRSPTGQKVHWFCSHHIRSNSFFLFLFSFFAETRLLRS